MVPISASPQSSIAAQQNNVLADRSLCTMQPPYVGEKEDEGGGVGGVEGGGGGLGGTGRPRTVGSAATILRNHYEKWRDN